MSWCCNFLSCTPLLNTCVKRPGDPDFVLRSFSGDGAFAPCHLYTPRLLSGAHRDEHAEDQAPDLRPSSLLAYPRTWKTTRDPRGENRRRGESKARGNEAEARPSRRIHGIYTPTSRRKVQLVTRRARNNGSTIVGPQLHVQRADLACLCFTCSSCGSSEDAEPKSRVNPIALSSRIGLRPPKNATGFTGLHCFIRLISR